MAYGHFDDAARRYVVTDPTPPRPWINYLGNRRLKAFISQNAGGLLWHLEPATRRLTRYHYVAPPGDRPGFYVYVRDRRTGLVWNPHFAPACEPLDRFECRHGPGRTGFMAEKDGVRVEVDYGIPPGDDVMLWRVSVTNVSDQAADVQVVSYLEFGLLEFMREVIGWCYLKNQLGFRYDVDSRSIRYDYHVFEAPATPAMAFGCTTEISGFDCSREAFIGRAGSLERPAALRAGQDLSGSELPLGGHGCGTLAVDRRLEPGATSCFAYLLAVGDSWEEADGLLGRYRGMEAVEAGLAVIDEFWAERLNVLQAATGDDPADRFVNTWNPYNSTITLELARTISTDHMGLDGLRYRDTTQDAMAVANIDPDFATARMRLVFAQQKRDGGGCFAFYPHTTRPTTDEPHRSDNTVWQVTTVTNLMAETGNLSLLEEKIPYRDGGDGTVYEHILKGLKHIHERRGPHGLPTLYHADWNDGLALFGDEQAESVMLALQMVYACRQFRELARRLGCPEDETWCDAVAAELEAICNSDAVWDGDWYRRLLLSNGKVIGSASARQGQIYVNPQSWAVLSGVGDRDGRGARAMGSVSERLDSDCGICILAPPFKGIPEPEDPPLGSNPGIGENGGIFCHANTWAIMAECLLGNGERAYKYYRQLLPETLAAKTSPEHYQREPYCYVSSIVGPVSDRFGEGGISWLSGTASWMYIAATQYIFGLRPTLDGLLVEPCLPASLKRVTIKRRFRGCLYDVEILNEGRDESVVEVSGAAVPGNLLVPGGDSTCRVVCRC